MIGRRRLVGETVIVHQAGPSIRGVLRAVHRDCFVLVHAFSLDDDVALAGEQVIPRVNGVWMQTKLPVAKPTA